jgi:hypothetical protein
MRTHESWKHQASDRRSVGDMEQIETFADERHSAFCAMCLGAPDTRDHSPSRVLLDEPFPENLPKVGCCFSCNNAISIDEEYVACVIECARLGTTDPERVERDKVRRILQRSPKLGERIANARLDGPDGPLWNVEQDRVTRVVLKLARGHAMFDLSESPREYQHLAIKPLCVLSDAERETFETLPQPTLWPEIGSRKFILAAERGPFEAWTEVQEGRYRYAAGVDASIYVRIVLSEYLACEVVFA